MPNVLQPSPADLEALDRGVVDAGLLAARAMARADALEAEVAALKEALYRVAVATGAVPPRRHLSLVPPQAG